MCGSAFGATAYDNVHGAAHDAFMALSPDTRTRESEVHLLGSGPKLCRLGLERRKCSLVGYTKKEKFMTTTARERIRERAGEEHGGGEEETFGGIHPLLVAALMGRRRGREEGEGIQHPLVLAALMARRRERGEGIHPLLLATLMARRKEREEGEGIQHPLVLAALMARRGEREEGEGISPFVLATLLSRRGEREKETV